MTQYEINNEYFKWLCCLVCGERFGTNVSYNKLLLFLHSVDFRFSIMRDGNRAEDGTDLRYRFASNQGDSRMIGVILDELNGPCSVLEMMVALSIRCEEQIMDDPAYGNRTGQWFWGMVVSLGLGAMTDRSFDKDFVGHTIERFLDREYEPNGKGGLFTIRNCKDDLRDVEIWYQLCWYLDSIM